MVRSLECLRGISTLTAFGLAVEIGDWERFSGSTIGAYLGLVPTEHSSGQSRSQGSITKTGNTHARRLLVEAAGHHRRPYPHPSQYLRSRWEHATPAAKARGQGPGPCRQPSPPREVADLPGAEEAVSHRERRDRPGTGRMVLVTGYRSHQ